MATLLKLPWRLLVLYAVPQDVCMQSVPTTTRKRSGFRPDEDFEEVHEVERTRKGSRLDASTS